MHQNNKPGGTFLYDSLDIPNPVKDKPTYRRDKSPLYILIFTLIGSGFILGLHTWAFHLIESYNDTYQIIGWVLLILLYTCIACVLVVSVMAFAVWAMNRANRVGLVNLLEHQTTISKMGRVETQYFDVIGRRMDQSLFDGVQNLTYSPHSTQHMSAPIPEDEPTIDEAITLEEDLPVLKSLQEQGMIGRSGNSILLGFGE